MQFATNNKKPMGKHSEVLQAIGGGIKGPACMVEVG
jgi:hypothetical protein